MTNAPAPWWLAALATPILTVIAYFLAAERRSVVTIVVAVEACQFALHEVFTAAAPAPAAAQPVLDPMCGSGHPVAVQDAMTMPGMHHSGGTGMLLAHLAAGIGAGLWLNLAERVSWQLLRTVAKVTITWVRRTIPQVVNAAPTRPRPHWTPTQHAPWSIRIESINRCILRRGPPRISLPIASASA